MSKKKKNSKIIRKTQNRNYTTKKENIKKKEIFVSVLKERLFTILFLNIALTFMIFIFSPMDIFLRNQKDFGIGVFDALLPLLISGIIFFIIISLIMLLIGKRAFKIFSALIFGILIASYIQMLFFNGKMLAFTGDAVNYSELTISNFINIFLFLCFLFLPLIFILLNKLFSDKKIFMIGNGKTIIYLSAFILIIQICGIIGTVFSVGLNNIYVARQNLNYRFSYENLTNLSKDNNIVVFLVDRLDGIWFDGFLDEYPEMKNELSGFTYYRDNISCYVNTFPSIPEMLTNSKHICGVNWDSYLKESWEKYSLTDILYENNYDVNLIIDKSTTYREVDDLFGEVDNIKVADKNYKINYIEENGILRIMLKMSIGKLSPYFTKNFFLNDINPDFSNNFIIHNTSDNEDSKNKDSNNNDSVDNENSEDENFGNEDSENEDSNNDDFVEDVVSFGSDLNFYNYIKNHNLNNNNKNETFNFIHLCGAHGVSDNITQLYQDLPESSLNSTIRGEFTIISEYIEQMKQINIYDNSTIIILGDHGRPPGEIENDKSDALREPIITALMIKPQNSESVPLIINDEAELSNANFIKSVLDCAGIKTESDEFEPSYFDIINNNLHPIRNINVRYLSDTAVCRYEVKGNARNFDNWKYFKEN